MQMMVLLVCMAFAWDSWDAHPNLILVAGIIFGLGCLSPGTLCLVRQENGKGRDAKSHADKRYAVLFPELKKAW